MPNSNLHLLTLLCVCARALVCECVCVCQHVCGCAYHCVHACACGYLSAWYQCILSLCFS